MADNGARNRPTTPPNQKPASNSKFGTVSSTPRSYVREQTKNMPAHREAVASAMKHEMVICPWDDFWKHYGLFELEDTDINKGIRALKSKSETARWLLSNGKWSDKIDLADRNENKYFGEVLDGICGILRKLKIDDRKNHCEPIHKPNKAAGSSIHGGSHKMDGAFYLLEKSARPSEYAMGDIVVSMEYKLAKDDKTVAENRQQLVANAVFALNEHPGRMFIYGLAIEGDQASLWYFSRSHSVVSEPLNWKENPRDFIAVLMMFLFATPQELGFDPSVQRHYPTGGKEYFVFKIEETKKIVTMNIETTTEGPITDATLQTTRYFKTIKCLSEFKPLCITGRTTRVWLVEEVNSFDDLTAKQGEPLRVLKDVWLNAEAKTERQIQDSIFADVEKFIQKFEDEGSSPKIAFATLSEPFQGILKELFKGGKFKRHFLSICCDGQGYTSKVRAPSARLCPELLIKPESALQAAQNATSDTSRCQSRTHDEPTQAKVDIPIVPRFHLPRRQYRVVYTEVAEAMQELTSFHDSMRALRGGLIGLIIMFLAGWVHRDVSGGNILWYSPNGSEPRGILSDLEYAKHVDDTTYCNDPKTGTPYFMALEIMSLKRIPKPDPESSDEEEEPDNIKIRAQQVVPNFLHDLESFWWLHLWTMLRVDHPESSSFSNLLFKNSTEGSFHRYSALIFGVYEDLACSLHEALVPLARECNGPRKVIYKEYLKYDNILNFPLSGDAPNRLMRLCEASIRHASNHPIPHLKPFTSVVPEQPLAVAEENPTSQSSDEGDRLTSRPAAQSATSDQVKSTRKKSTRGQKPATSNGKSTTTSRITRSSSVRKAAVGGNGSQSAGGSASKSIDEGTPREDGAGPARKIRRTS